MKKIVIQNLIITSLSKLLNFLSFIYIAKELSRQEYGLFVYINMILSLLPLLQFGSMHGIVILLPKKIAKNKNEENIFFWNYNTFSHLIQILSVVILIYVDFKLNISIIFVIAINFILSKYPENVQIFLNSKLELQKANIIKLLDQVIRPIITLFIFSNYKSIEAIFVSQLITSLIVFIISCYLLKFEIFLYDNKSMKTVIKQIYSLGFFVYLSWAIDIIFRTADRWFISQFYTIDELATYGFTSSLSLNIWLFSMSFFAPYSQLLYKHISENNFLEAKNCIEQTNKKLYILLIVMSTLAIVSYPVFIKYIVHEYYGTEKLFIILVLVSIFLSINNMYIYYMISNSLYFLLLKYQFVILILNITLNSIFTYFHLDIIYFSYSTIFALAIYYILVKNSFYNDINKRLGVS